MYDDLVKLLREHNGWALNETLDEAADAIEELQQIASHYEEESKGWWLAACDFKEERERLLEAMPRWIPVTERLPCLTTLVLITDGIVIDIAWMYGVPPRWITSFTAIDEDKLTHWMPLPQTPKEVDT